MKKCLAILLAICTWTMVSCLDHRHKNDDRLCTEEFRMLTVSIKDSYSNPVLLSDYFVKKTSTGEVIDFAMEDPWFDSICRTRGTYIICTDGNMSLTSGQGTEFEFHGFLDSLEIVNEPYIIGNDECHVIMISGRQEIVIGE